VEPAGHVAPDELNRSHAADFGRISLPQRAVQQPARLPFPGFDRLCDFQLFELCNSQPTVVHKHWLARVRIDHTTQVPARAWNPVSMAPEVAELGPFPADNKQRRSATQRKPALP